MTNRLLRQYFSKGTDLSDWSQSDLDRIALRLNQRPRKTLDVRCPADVFNETVALTGLAEVFRVSGGSSVCQIDRFPLLPGRSPNFASSEVMIVVFRGGSERWWIVNVLQCGL